MSAHPMSDGDTRPRSPQPAASGSPFDSDDLEMDTSRLTAPYSVQSSTVPALPPHPVVIDEATSQPLHAHERAQEEGDEARHA